MDEESKKNEIREEFQEVLDDFNDDPSPDVNDYKRRLFAIKTKFTSTISYQKVSLRHFLDFEHREYLKALQEMNLSRNTVRTSKPATQAQAQQNISSATSPQFQGLGMQPIVSNPQNLGLGMQPIMSNPQFQGLGMVRPTSQIMVNSSSNQPSRFGHVVFDKAIPVDNSDNIDNLIQNISKIQHIASITNASNLSDNIKQFRTILTSFINNTDFLETMASPVDTSVLSDKCELFIQLSNIDKYCNSLIEGIKLAINGKQQNNPNIIGQAGAIIEQSMNFFKTMFGENYGDYIAMSNEIMNLFRSKSYTGFNDKLQLFNCLYQKKRFVNEYVDKLLQSLDKITSVGSFKTFCKDFNSRISLGEWVYDIYIEKDKKDMKAYSELFQFCRDNTGFIYADIIDVNEGTISIKPQILSVMLRIRAEYSHDKINTDYFIEQILLISFNNLLKNIALTNPKGYQIIGPIIQFIVKTKTIPEHKCVMLIENIMTREFIPCIQWLDNRCSIHIDELEEDDRAITTILPSVLAGECTFCAMDCGFNEAAVLAECRIVIQYGKDGILIWDAGKFKTIGKSQIPTSESEAYKELLSSVRIFDPEPQRIFIGEYGYDDVLIVSYVAGTGFKIQINEKYKVPSNQIVFDMINQQLTTLSITEFSTTNVGKVINICLTEFTKNQRMRSTDDFMESLEEATRAKGGLNPTYNLAVAVLCSSARLKTTGDMMYYIKIMIEGAKFAQASLKNEMPDFFKSIIGKKNDEVVDQCAMFLCDTATLRNFAYNYTFLSSSIDYATYFYSLTKMYSRNPVILSLFDNIFGLTISHGAGRDAIVPTAPMSRQIFVLAEIIFCGKNQHDVYYGFPAADLKNATRLIDVFISDSRELMSYLDPNKNNEKLNRILNQILQALTRTQFYDKAEYQTKLLDVKGSIFKMCEYLFDKYRTNTALPNDLKRALSNYESFKTDLFLCSEIFCELMTEILSYNDGEGGNFLTSIDSMRHLSEDVLSDRDNLPPYLSKGVIMLCKMLVGLPKHWYLRGKKLGGGRKRKTMHRRNNRILKNKNRKTKKQTKKLNKRSDKHKK